MLTFSGSPGLDADSVAAADLVVFADAHRATPTDTAGKQLLGLAALIDDVSEGQQTVQNIDRNTYPIFRGNHLANGGAPRELSLDLIQQGIDTGHIESGMEADFMVGGYGQRRKYLNLLWYDVRYGPQRLEGGFSVLKYNNLDWVVDKDCQPNRLYFMVKEYLQKYVVAPIGILDQAGTQLERLPKQDVYELLIGGYFNTGHEQPNSAVKLADLSEL